FKVITTKHGPVLTAPGTTQVSLSWTGADPKTPTLETIYNLNRAQTWQDFEAALSTYSGSTQSFIMCDRRGNIGFQVAGNIPLRANVRGNAGSILTPGWTGVGDWVSRLPFQSLPHAYNPPSGFIVAEAQSIPGMTLRNNQYRAQRINFVLSECRKHGNHMG